MATRYAVRIPVSSDADHTDWSATLGTFVQNGDKCFIQLQWQVAAVLYKAGLLAREHFKDGKVLLPAFELEAKAAPAKGKGKPPAEDDEMPF